MSKRFTDTDKWSRPWFRSLPMEYKLFWLYICDSCNVAGVWYVDLDLASFVVGFKLDITRAKALFDKQITEMEGRWFIKDFMDFQYGNLRPNNNFHRSIISCAKTYGLDVISGVSQGLVRGTPGDKEKDKEKERSRRRGGEGVGEEDFDPLWKRFPRRVGRKAAIRHFLTSVTKPEQLPEISKALDNYLTYLRAEKIERRYVQNGSTWFYNWEDWVDYRAAVPPSFIAPPPRPKEVLPDESELPTGEEVRELIEKAGIRKS